MVKREEEVVSLVGSPVAVGPTKMVVELPYQGILLLETAVIGSPSVEAQGELAVGYSGGEVVVA